MPYTLGFEEVYWNFSEAAYGKGAADGVGAAVKRLCDNLVLSGKELTDAKSVCNAINELTTSKVRIYEIDSDFSSVYLPEKLIPSINGLLRVHQVVSVTKGTVYTREVSCYYSAMGMCKCFKPEKHNVLQAVKTCVMKQLLESVVKELQLCQSAPSVTEPSDVKRIFYGKKIGFFTGKKSA